MYLAFVLTFPLCLAYCSAKLSGSGRTQVPDTDRQVVDLVIGQVSEETEDTAGSVIRVNADFDEKNRSKEGNPLADYQPHEKHGHRIVGDDPNLEDASLSIAGEASRGRWRLIFPENIKIWIQSDDSSYEEVIASRFSQRVETPFFCRLKIEGIKGSRSADDVRILAEFAPQKSKAACRDSAFLTVLETRFTVTFDDGPLPDKTDRIVRALKRFYCDGEPLRAGFFQVVEKIRKFPDLTRFADENGHLVFNRALSLERLAPAVLDAEKIEEVILRWEKEIYLALGRKPERIIRKRLKTGGQRFERDLEKLGARVCGGELTFDFRAASAEMLKSRSLQILEQWNTRQNPQLHPYPAILIFHEFPDVTYDHIGEIISHLQDQGFVLVHFDPQLIY